MTGKTLNNRYLVGELIGSGGMAIVYKGHDAHTGKTVAIKMLRPEFNEDEEFMERFIREAQVAASLNHENLIDIFDVSEQDGIYYIVMEYIDGLTLKELIHRQGRLDNYTAISIARQMCLAMRLVHRAHIVHRDIKPQNILLDRKGIAKLTDFGIAKAAGADTITNASEKGVLGSVHYFSPEQARGEKVGLQSDVYSLGVVLYEMLAGEAPFDGETPIAVALHHLHTPPPSVRLKNPKATKALDEIIQKALAKEPSQRYQSAEMMYSDLGQALIYPDGGFVRAETAKSAASSSPQGEREEQRASQDAQEEGEEAQKHHHGPSVLLTIALCLGFLGLLGYFASILFLKQMVVLPGWRPAPGVVGSNVDAAAQRYEKEGLSIEIAGTIFDDTIQAGNVIAQEPMQNFPIRSDGAIRVTVCRGPEFPAVPSVVGKTIDEAKEILRLSGLKAGSIVQDESSDAPRGTVLEQYVKAGETRHNGDEISLCVSARPVVRAVPKLTGQSREAAEEALKEAGLTLGEVGFEQNAAMEPDQIVRQDPLPGMNLGDGEPVQIWINRALAQSTHSIEIEVPEDQTKVMIYQEDHQTNEVKLLVEVLRDKGPFQVDLDLVSIEPGENEVVIYLNGVERKRETVILVEAP
ncbi:MAG: Stk1 family PASTA domain-containing Ser/Thr kinase [Christensenellaceae bacterium]|jgi:serine/threonine-protein kinase|nr:Stk1 family PASTA domain-containing Ser/Thr kinase [Christensenellaceae bacterium]